MPVRFERARGIEQLDPPHAVLALLHAGDAVLLGGLTDEDLEGLGLTEPTIEALLRDDGVFDARESEQVLGLWRSSRTGDFGWIQDIQPFFEVDEDWRAVVVTSWALRNAHFDAEALVHGSVGARANTLLMLSGMESTVTDVQAIYLQLAAEVAEGKVTTFENVAFVASSAIVGGVVGSLTLGAGIGQLSKVAGWMGEKMIAVDDWVEDLSFRWLAASWLVESDPARVAVVANSFYVEAGEISRSQPSVAQGKRVRMLLAAYRGLSEELAQHMTANGPLMPNLVSMRLGDARESLKALGIDRVTPFDAVAPDGQARSYYNASKWVVCGQWPDEGAALADAAKGAILGYCRPGERVPGHFLQKRLVEVRNAVAGG